MKNVSDGRDELIPYRGAVSMYCAGWSSFRSFRNVVVQIVVFDNGVRSYRLHESVFEHELAGIFH